MSQTYFKNFNTINYDTIPAIDLTERIVVQRSTQYNPFIFYPMDITDGIRPDMVSYSQWGDPFASWILYLTNDIIDPYYDWYLTREQFINFITSKYGSVTKSQQLILYYQTDYASTLPITISGYHALDAGQQQYFEPNYNNGYNILNYTQKKDTLTTTTNYVLQLSITGSIIPFVDTELLQISYVHGSNGTAQYVAGNTTSIIVQHGINDAFPFPDNPNTSVVIGNASYVYGVESGANAQITAYKFLSINIPLEEEIFWSPVYAYDYEDAKNAGNRIINVMQPKYVPTFVNKTANLLSQVVR